MQLSAQRVVRENERLKQLLRHKGVDDDVVALWIRADDDRPNEATACTVRSQEKPSQDICFESVWHSMSYFDVLQSLMIIPHGKKQEKTTDPVVGKLIKPANHTQQPALEGVESTRKCLASTSHLSSQEGSQTSPTKPCAAEASSTTIFELSRATPLAPCKLNTLLKANPAADLTQIPKPVDGRNKSDGPEGVECYKAYEMLMQYATTETKLDTIVSALEGGCVRNKGVGGGCRVRTDVMWKTLDDLEN